MVLKLTERLKNAWNAFREKDQEQIRTQDIGPSYFYRPDRIAMRFGSERSIISSIYTRIAIDVAAIKIQHIRVDEEDRFVGVVDSGLNYCLTTEANIDQTSRALIQDLVESMCDEGVVAVVPEETSLNPMLTGSYDIRSLRVAKILQWYPEYIKVNMYDRRDGRKKDIILPKKIVAIIQNPLYDVMNEPNSTMRRLIHKLNLLDAIDEKTSSGKLDLIIHLPYMTKTQMRKDEAERRRKELEEQLANSKYGVAYTDATEKITQLNRPIENNIMDQIEYLTNMLYSQLGMTKEVLDGTANEQVMLNYFSRTIEPIISAICDEFNRKFLTKTARSQNQRVMFFRDLFKLTSLNSIVSMGQAFTTAAIMTPNEVRQKLGMKPSDDPTSNELSNRNINVLPNAGEQSSEQPPELGEQESDIQNEADTEPLDFNTLKVSDLFANS